MQLRGVTAQSLKGRVDERLREAVARHQRAACRAAAPESVAKDTPKQPGRPLVDAGVERGDGQRLPQSGKERAPPVERLADRRLRTGATQGEHVEIIDAARTRDPPASPEDPPRKSPAIRPQDPPLPGRHVDKRESRVLGAVDRAARADPLEIVERAAIAGEQQMVAVVETAAELGVEIGTAAPAGMAARLVEPHFSPGGGQGYRGREPGKPGADDMGPAAARSAAHRKPWRSTSHSFAARDKATRAAGSRHSPRISSRNVAR